MAGCRAAIVVGHLPVLRERPNHGTKRVNNDRYSVQKVEQMPIHSERFNCTVYDGARVRLGAGNWSPIFTHVGRGLVWIHGVNVLKRNLSKNSQMKPFSQTRVCVVRALAMEVTAFLPDEGKLRSWQGSRLTGSGMGTIPSLPPNRADDPSLGNPLLRFEHMGCGWLGVIMEWEGVIVEDDPRIENRAWLALAEEEGKRSPATFILQRVEGMKNEHAISEVLCWSRDPINVRRLASRKEELYQEMQGGLCQLRPGSQEFLVTLKKHKIPIALASTRPRKYLEKAIEAVGMQGFFDVVVAAEDVYRGKPDPEMIMYAAQLLNIICERCILFGNSNSSVEASHDICMKCVGVAGKHPVFELGAADMVVRRLDDLSLVDLKNLADLDSPEFQPPEPEPELELEDDADEDRVTAVGVQDIW